MSFWGKNPIEKAIDVVGSVANQGLSMWDESDFTAQEKSKLFVDLLAATKSQATSISRRNLLWFIISMTGVTLLLALLYNHLGMVKQYDGLVEIIEVWKIGWAFVGTVSFYFLTQFSGAGRTK